MTKQMILGIAVLLALAADVATAKTLCLRDVDNNPSLLDIVITDPGTMKVGDVVPVGGLVIGYGVPAQLTGSAVRTSNAVAVYVSARALSFQSPALFLVSWVAADESLQGAGGVDPFLNGTIDVEIDLVSVDCASVTIP
jgi:hypothetical protein